MENIPTKDYLYHHELESLKLRYGKKKFDVIVDGERVEVTLSQWIDDGGDVLRLWKEMARTWDDIGFHPDMGFFSTSMHRFAKHVEETVHLTIGETEIEARRRRVMDKARCSETDKDELAVRVDKLAKLAEQIDKRLAAIENEVGKRREPTYSSRRAVKNRRGSSVRKFDIVTRLDWIEEALDDHSLGENTYVSYKGE